MANQTVDVEISVEDGWVDVGVGTTVGIFPHSIIPYSVALGTAPADDYEGIPLNRISDSRMEALRLSTTGSVWIRVRQRPDAVPRSKMRFTIWRDVHM